MAIRTPVHSDILYHCWLASSSPWPQSSSGPSADPLTGPPRRDIHVRRTDASVSFTISSRLVAVAFIGAVAVITVLLETVHGLVHRGLGTNVSYGVAPRLGAFYVAAFHQFQGRNDNVVVGLAPLVVLDVLLLPVLFVPTPLLAFASFIAPLFDTAGSAGDLFLVAGVPRMPPGTLLQDSDARHSYVVYPAG